MSTYSWPNRGGGVGVIIYPNFAAFPATAPNGTIAADAGTHILYEYNSTSVAWEPIASNTAYLDALASAGAATSIGALDAQVGNANGAALVGHVLSLQSASATVPGLVNLTTQSFSGNKTFTGTLAASNLSGTNTGDVTISTANGLSLVGQALSLALSSASTVGALSAADWTTFNAKQAALTFGNLTDVGTDGITITGGTGAVIGAGTAIAQHVADATHNGYLSSTDWSTFNGKQSALTFPLAIALGGTNANNNTQAFNNLSPMAALGDTIYGGAAGVGSRLAGNTTTTKKFYTQTGDGVNSAQPAWLTIASNDLPTNGVSNSILAQMPTLTLKGNNTGVTANALDLTVAQVNTMLGTLSNPMTTLGDIIFENATPTPARLAGNTTATLNVLTQTGTGAVSAAPVWSTLAAAYGTQAAGTFLAGPSSGASANPTFRALTAPTIQTFTTGSGTYTTPAGALYIRVRMVGGGGGGGGGGGNGGVGGTTTFGTSLLTANGGQPGNNSGPPGSGGSASIGAGAVGTTAAGSGGSAAGGNIVLASGGSGGASAFGGAGYSRFGGQNAVGGDGTMGGGGGGAAGAGGSGFGGGGAGGFVDALIQSPSATYSYSVGAAGTAGAASPAGGAGGSGYIEVTEYYQ